MEEEMQGVYGIAAVAKRTGLATPNIRMWEKRHQAVVPARTDTNRRLYSAEDIERLILMKQLTDRGHAISTVAGLSLPQLSERWDQELVSVDEESDSSSRKSFMTIGPVVAALTEDEEFLNAVAVAGYDTIEDAEADSELVPVDLLVIETESLFPETVTMIRNLVNRTHCSAAILLYRFSTSKTATALARAISGLTLLKAPVGDRQLKRECLVKLGLELPRSSLARIDESAPIPERLFSARQLARLARISTTVECECPQHLAGLLQGLAAFEKYSSECEDRNPADAALHSFLHRTTAAVRLSMEEALDYVVQAEGLSVE